MIINFLCFDFFLSRFNHFSPRLSVIYFLPPVSAVFGRRVHPSCNKSCIFCLV